MAELKTKETNASVRKFLDDISDESKRADAYALMAMMQRATKSEPKMWGSSIIGFGNLSLIYDSGRELDWFTMGFSPRRQAFTLYGTGWTGHEALLQQLGKHSLGKGCLYIKRLGDVDKPTLQKLLAQAAKDAKSVAKEMEKKKQNKTKKPASRAKR
jgi:hypothetical protein